MTAAKSVVERSMPHAVESERALLGGLLLDGDRWLVVCDIVAAGDFYRPEHAALYRLLAEMAGSGQPIDLVAVSERVHRAGPERFGGAGYVAELPEHAPSAANLPHYAERIRHAAMLRRLIYASTEILRAAYGEAVADLPITDDADVLVQASAAHLAHLSAPLERRTWRVGEAVRLTEEERLDAMARGAKEVTTGFEDLDEALDGGMRAGELVVIGGSTSMGKSALAMSIAFGAARAGAIVGYASVEPRRPEWAYRALACVSRIPLRTLRGPRRSPRDEELVVDWTSALEDWRVELYYRAGGYFREIATQARRWKLLTGLDVLVIDYLQLMRHERRGERHDLAVGETVGDCKRLAGELGIAVVLLSQVTRSSTKDQIQAAPGRNLGTWHPWWSHACIPRPQDLKESGSIENDADVILFPVRADKAGAHGRAIEEAGPDAALIAVAKQRNGRTGIVPAQWDGPCACYRATPPRLT